MQKDLTFDLLPKAIQNLTNEVSELKSLLLDKQEQKQEQPEKLFSIKQAAQFLNLSIPTIYSKVSKGELPFMKRSKRLYFSSSELMAYLKEGRNMSNSEIEKESATYLLNHKKGLK